jgi:NADH:ubiquinone oxidoreductase subunit K
MIPIYLIALCFAIFAVGIGGVASSRHFLIMMISVEVAITASALLAVTFFYYSAGGNILVLLLTIWAVALAEVMALVAVYRYLARAEVSMDVTKLSNLKN